jgi:hypothetical protein
MTINADQVQSLVRLFLTFLGALAVSLGYLKQDDVNVLTTDVLTAVGPLLVLGSAVWGLFAHTTTAKLDAVLKLPDVIKVDMKDSAARDAVAFHPKVG